MTAAQVVVERRGAGEPLVLLHGIGHHWRGWLPVLDRLAATHDVIAVDLPGFGGSPLPAGGLVNGVPDLVAAVAELLDQLGLDRPHVAGNSLGGAIALELAAAGRVASATALAPAGFWTARQLRWTAALLTAHRTAARLPVPVLRAVLALAPLRALSFRMMVARTDLLTAETALADSLALRAAPGFRAVARSARRYAFRGAPTVPVTVAWGTRDRILSPRQAARARRLLPDARHVTLPDCGHLPMGDDPELVTSVILTTTGAVAGEVTPGRADAPTPHPTTDGQPGGQVFHPGDPG